MGLKRFRYPRNYPLKEQTMRIYSTIRRLAATVLASTALVATVCGAQPITVNGVSCTAANAVTVTYNGGALNINTGGCGTTPVPPATSPPTISSVTPSSGAPGDNITINGTNLSGAAVSFGASNANILTNSSTQIVATVPSATPGITNITVTTSVAPAATFAFTVTAPTLVAPAISSTSAQTGPPGTVLTISGSGFTGATVTIGGVAANITVSSATSITTSVPASAPTGAGRLIVTTASGSSSRDFTVTAIPQGADVSVDGITLPAVSKQPNVTPGFRQGLSGAGLELNAYAMDPTRCNTTPALTRSWQHNVRDPYQSIDIIAMKSGEALSYKFTTGMMQPIGGGIAFADSAQSGANIRPAYMTLTPTPCDFDTSKVLTNTSGNGCYISGINGVTVNWAIFSEPLPASYCKLEAGKTYYLNIRFLDVRPGGNSSGDSCRSGETCGGILQFF